MFTPTHKLVETEWIEHRGDAGREVRWSFGEGQVTLTHVDNSQQIASWSEIGGRLRVVMPAEAGGMVLTGSYSDDVLKAKERVLTLEAEDGSAPRRLSWSRTSYYPETGVYSREWYYYWNRFVPESGQADTVQGEILRITLRLSGMYLNSGGGNWLDAPITHDAYAEVTLAVLCEGTLDATTTEFVRKTVTELQKYCSEEEEPTDPAPEVSDVNRLADLALDWCRQHAEPIPRVHDPRMAF